MPDHVVHVDAPPRDAERALLDSVDGAVSRPDGTVAGTLSVEGRDPVVLTAAVEAADGGTRVELRAERPGPVPYFEFFFRPISWWLARRRMRHLAASITARATAAPPPPPLRRHPLAPPVTFSDDDVRMLATVAAVATVAAFGASLFSNNVDFIGDAFDVSNRSLGVAGAVTRVGILLSLVATALADRQGRRRLLLVSLAGVSLASGVSAISPNLAVLTGAQLVARGFFNAALTVAAIAAVEESPEGGRAYTLAMLTLATGVGFAFATVLLPLGDLGPEAWRLSFVANAAFLVLLPRLSRDLKETLRYRRVEAGHTARGRLGDVLRAAHRKRFLLLVAAGLLTQVLAAPSAQFTNRFLGDEQGFSGLDITVFRTVTSALPPIVALFIGGRLAESWGRKRLAVPGKILATVATMLFFVSTGPTLWILGTVQVFLASLIAPALAAFGPELFPTQIRGTANAYLLVAGVCGSAIGLVGVGALSDTTSLGTAIAWAGLAPIVSAVLILPFLPEASKRDLDVVSPPPI